MDRFSNRGYIPTKQRMTGPFPTRWTRNAVRASLRDTETATDIST